MRKGAILAGAGARVRRLDRGGDFRRHPGGSYDESTVTEYVKSSHFLTVVA